jgi:hypothetical protein
MTTAARQLITIVAESVVEQKLIDDIKKCGAKGYSVSRVTGKNTLDLNGPSIRLESVVTEKVAESILEMLAEKYFEKFAVIAWITPALVARPDRF